MSYLYFHLAWYFIRPTSVIQTITAREVFMRVTIKDVAKLCWRRAFNCHASSKTNPMISDETKTCP